jgi:hypothetical protein
MPISRPMTIFRQSSSRREPVREAVRPLEDRYRPPSRPPGHARRWPWYLLLGVLAVLLAARIVAPYVVLAGLNRQLAVMPGYSGHVESVSLHLYRGAYQLNHLTLHTNAGIAPGVSVSCRRIDIGVQWGPLLHGKLVASLSVLEPIVVIQNQPAVATLAVAPSSARPAPTWQQQVQSLFPIAIDVLQVSHGKLRYRDEQHHLDLALGSITLGLTNLTNNARASSQGNRVASFKAEGSVIGGGELRFGGDIDPYATLPTFTLELALEHFDLTAINPLLINYEKIHINQGKANIFLELQSRQGKISGYLKPLFSDLSVFRSEDIERKGISALKEAVVGAVAEVFKNHPKDRFAGKIPLEGDITDPRSSVLSTIGSIFRNAFIQALQPGFDHPHQHAPGEVPPAQAAEKADRALTKAQAKGTH